MFRLRRGGRKDGRRGKVSKDVNPTVDLVIPAHFRCPISLDLMKDPVTLCTGITYDRQSIDTWIDSGNRTCPVTNQPLKSLEQIPNHTIRKMIQDWCVENRSYGIERIPTPRIPVTTAEVEEILSEINGWRRCKDETNCLVLVRRISALGKESERNQRCIAAAETACVLAETFDAFAGECSMDSHAAILEEILLALTWIPLGNEARAYLGSSASLRCMTWFLECGSLGGRRAAVLAVRNLASSEQRHLKALAATDGLVEALVKVVKEPICPTTTKGSLMAMYYMREKVGSRFVELGLVSVLLEMLVDSEKSICEKALSVLDGLCDCKEGLGAASQHALTVPVLVKKMLRVSNLATELAVSALWKLCKRCEAAEGEEEGRAVVESLQVGAFQKVLLLLQVGCGEATKEKATELLKLLNGRRGRLECIDSMDFKQLKRPF